VKLARNGSGDKIAWEGGLLSVQPRIRLTRSFDQRSHIYLGYALKVRGMVGSEAREFLVAVGGGANAKHQFQAGLLSPVMRCRFRMRGWRQLNSTRFSKLKVRPPGAVALVLPREGSSTTKNADCLLVCTCPPNTIRCSFGNRESVA
jgi:hypothetical protein